MLFHALVDEVSGRLTQTVFDLAAAMDKNSEASHSTQNTMFWTRPGILHKCSTLTALAVPNLTRGDILLAALSSAIWWKWLQKRMMVVVMPTTTLHTTAAGLTSGATAPAGLATCKYTVLWCSTPRQLALCNPKIACVRLTICRAKDADRLIYWSASYTLAWQLPVCRDPVTTAVLCYMSQD